MRGENQMRVGPIRSGFAASINHRFNKSGMVVENTELIDLGCAISRRCRKILAILATAGIGAVCGGYKR